MASFKPKFPVLQEPFAKNHRGTFGPTPEGRGLTEMSEVLKRQKLSMHIVQRDSAHRTMGPQPDLA